MTVVAAAVELRFVIGLVVPISLLNVVAIESIMAVMVVVEFVTLLGLATRLLVEAVSIESEKLILNSGPPPQLLAGVTCTMYSVLRINPVIVYDVCSSTVATLKRSLSSVQVTI